MIKISFKDGTSALVSDQDSDLLKYRWWKTQGYPATRINRIFTYQHRIILERILGRKLLHGEYTDHINRNRLDNRRENLRIATNSENLRNRDKRANTSSNYIGVTYFTNASKRVKRWKAYIKLGKKQHTVGYILTEIEAARARDVAARKHYENFARLNNV